MQRTQARFGLSEDQWIEAVAEVRAAIVDAAAERRMTNYSEVAASISCTPVEPFSSLLNHLLGAVFAEEHESGRPLLTAIVTHKSGDLEPGAGFYEMARSLGYRFPEPYVFWAQQVQAVFKAYGQARQ